MRMVSNIPLDENCCKEDQDSSDYQGAFFNALGEGGKVIEENPNSKEKEGLVI